MPHFFEAAWRHRAVLASGATVAAAAVVVSTLAVLYEGIPTADLELDDGGVWVTKADDLLVGHVNYPSRLLDGAVRTRAGEFDVLQDEHRVIVLDSGAGTATVVDPARVELAGDTTLPAAASLALGGDTVAVAGQGLIHSIPFASLGSATFSEDDAVAKVGENAVVAATRDGARIFAASVSTGAVTTIHVETGVATDAPIDVADDAALQLAAVGDAAVAFDATNGVLFRPDGTAVEIPGGAEGRIQQTSHASDAVYVATPDGLVRVGLGAGEPEVVAAGGGGSPAAPVSLGGCVYAVWSAPAHYVRDCADDASDLETAIDAPDAATLVLRTNRRVVLVNDTSGGTVWAVDDQVQRIDNWDDIVPPPDDDSDDEESQEEQPQFQLPDRTAENNPPTAEDDEYGVRAGRSTILRVTENDTDPDGDLLSASLVGEAPTGTEIVSVLGGAALQIAVPANATGALSFRYLVDDGRDGTDEATVTVTVRPPDQNEPPRPKNDVEALRVEAGGSITADVLEGWMDPDGDDIFLRSATIGDGDTVAFRSSGVIEYTAASRVVGAKEIAVVVSDGTDDAEGIVRVDVRPEDSLDPVANADRVTATAGVPITVSPLANDVSPTGAALRLTQTDHPAGASVTPDYAAGTFEFVASTPDSYYVQYFVTLGARSAIGIVRIDVIAADAGDARPVAVRDVALLPVGRDVLVDVLSNDSDPAGGILVVQSARSNPGAGIGVEVLQHSILRITDAAGLSAPTTVTYTVSNGTQSATGEVMVIPVPLPATLRPPVTVDDQAVVRAGDVVSIPVLANDYHPDNDRLTLSPVLRDVTGVDAAQVFVDGDRVRLEAPDEPGTVYFAYDVEDSQLQRVGGYVTVQVVPVDAETNSAPRPKPVIARAIAGNTVRIAIPLDGIDDNGDSVELIGPTSIPGKGRVTVGDSWLTYEAFLDASGRDTFTYAVRDRLGATAESTVTVGVAAPGYENQAPYAVKDTVIVKPDRRVSVAVTANDSDPDGDEIMIVADDLVVPGDLEAAVEGGRVVVTSPSTPGDYTITYTIADTFGATAQGVLLVTVDPDAPRVAPIARDDRVTNLSLGADPTVDVAVLENDEDPDGTTDALNVAAFEDDVVVRAGGVLRIPVGADPRVVRYSITDEDDNVAQAFVFVPGLARAAPVVSTTEPVVVVSGETITLPIAEHVHVRSGLTPRIATADSVRTGHSNGAPLIADEHTLTYTSADGYFGPDAIGLLVTDGDGPDDAEGLMAFVSIPILVLPAENQSPRLRNATVTVAPGEEGVTLNLAKLAFDPDDGDAERLTFAIDGDVPAGYDASVQGDTLSVRANADVEAGSTAAVVIRVDDGVSTPGTGTMTFQAVTSQRPFPVANNDVVARANQGETYRVAVLANDYNPFEDRGPLTIISARLDTGDGTVAVDGDRVVITPSDSFVGTMIVTYRIADATNAVERQTDARVTLTVQGRPGAPGVPTVTSVQDRTVVLAWAPSAANGAPISEYTVRSSNGVERSCVSTVCTIDGLTNDVEYIFTVTASNEVGESDPSPASAVARPDARPDAPAPPVLVFGDASLAVSWTPPRSTGSPVLSYNLEISPAPARGAIQKTGVTGTSLTWDGLQNGVAYRVRVQAVNRSPEPSEWGPYSGTMVPATVPDAPGQPQAGVGRPVGPQAQIGVSWTPPASDNGDPVSGYVLSVKRGGSVLQTIEVAGLSQSVVVEPSQTDYIFSVVARNKAGLSAASADSAPRRGAVEAGAPTALVATPGDSSMSVSFAEGELNGNRPEEITYRYRIEPTGAQGTLPAGGGVVGGLSNGSQYTIRVWVTSPVSEPGRIATSNEVVPFGKPIITWQSTERLDGAVRFRWNVNPNGSPLTQASHGGEGNAEHTVTGLAASESTTLNVSFTNAAGQSTASWSGQASDPPPKSATVTKTGANSFRLNYVSFPPGSYYVKCWNDDQHANASTLEPDYIGQVGNLSFGASGSMDLSCPITPPSGKFSVEIQGIYWTPTITW